jgi:hypothetical protein
MYFVRTAINLIGKYKGKRPPVRITRGLPESMILKWVLKYTKLLGSGLKSYGPQHGAVADSGKHDKNFLFI